MIYEARLTDISGHSSIGRADVVDLDYDQRMKRAMKRAGGFFLAGLVFVPIPFIHFFVPPIFFAFSVYAFFQTLKQLKMVPTIKGSCPNCSADVEFKNHRFAGFQKDVCPSCRQQLKIEILSAMTTPASPAPLPGDLSRP